ncbi:MAG: hypothetical protein IPP06_10640 [Saprospiraceae bacterium]|nr:hypothetical protein [Candidatus Vicinibacter affinis]MBP6172490.1 hypothetical protein [Saprospiraceae bacterium]MBK6572824.1 hypothetical protein [Candidatus Vicinibacter affinis]MBK6824610.1 hypothetical protein [Candidatus Vicinibacter affinis]MBK7798592.1 hypothetical protein [Candidatus Vicinibacter affinis]
MKILLGCFCFGLFFLMACTSNTKPPAEKQVTPVNVEAVAPNLPPPDSLNMKHEEEEEEEKN